MSVPPAITAAELARLFLRLGCTAFGGPAAHIAMLRAEVVERRAWMREDEFLDLLGATNLIPGPNSTEMAIQIGYRLLGWRGLLLGGVCFILPAALMVTALAALYRHFGKLPATAAVLRFVKPVVVAVIAQAVWGLRRSAAKSFFLMALGAVVAVAALCTVPPLPLLFGGAVASAMAYWVTEWRAQRTPPTRSLVACALVAFAVVNAAQWLTHNSGAGVGPDAVAYTEPRLFAYFLKIGAVLYGSGYVLIAFLREGLVANYRWLTQAQLIDATAVGQLTPGPVFTTATFIGYLVGDWRGAVLATVAIFLPSFVLVALSGALIPRLRRSAVMGAFLDGANVAALALMMTVTLQLARDACASLATAGATLLAEVLLIRYKVNSTWLILGGIVLGLVSALR